MKPALYEEIDRLKKENEKLKGIIEAAKEKIESLRNPDFRKPESKNFYRYEDSR